MREVDKMSRQSLVDKRPVCITSWQLIYNANQNRLLYKAPTFQLIQDASLALYARARPGGGGCRCSLARADTQGVPIMASQLLVEPNEVTES